ncbi:MAG: MFS transporter [Deltaproteobacteria bacterium]|nr:MFS transporter [Deltaproteobacteria bacterium]
MCVARRGDLLKTRRPWWAWLFFYATPPPGVTPHHWQVLGALGATYLFNSYDLGVLNMALPQIQAGLGVPETQVGLLAGIVRLGVLPALALTMFADRVGRRRLLLVTVLGFSACTFLTSFCRNASEFIFLQFMARMFIYSQEMLAIVVITEELDASARGWGIGMLIAFGGLGHGLAAAVFSTVDFLPYGWRALYFVGFAPLLLTVWMRRVLTETRRFTAHQRERGSLEVAWLDPLRELITRYPVRVAALTAALFPVAVAGGTIVQFQSKFLQAERGYSPGEVSVLFLAGGVLAIGGGLLCGLASDRFGRRRVLSAAILVNTLAAVGFYRGLGAIVPLAWVGVIFTQFGIDVLFAALGSELFATSHRSTASGVRSLVATLGIAAGLACEGLLYTAFGNHGQAVAAMAVCALAGPVFLLWMVPETAGRELEEIAGDSRAA